MIQGFDIEYTPGPSTPLALHHVQPGTGILLQLGLIPFAIGALHILFQILVVKFLNVPCLVYALQDKVLFPGAETSIRSQLRSDVVHDMFMGPVNGCNYLIEVSPKGFRGSHSPDVGA